jgi:hypothetical protein
MESKPIVRTLKTEEEKLYNSTYIQEIQTELRLSVTRTWVKEHTIYKI